VVSAGAAPRYARINLLSEEEAQPASLVVMAPALLETLEVSTPSDSSAMSASVASPSWHVPASVGAWRFGRALHAPGQAGGVQWVLRRNCSLTPAQLGGFYLSMCAVSLIIATGFALNGAPVVLWFAGIELVLLAVALLVYARHAADADTVTLTGQMLTVEQSCGNACTTTQFRTAWLSVEPLHGDGSLIELAGQGQTVHIGRFLRPEARAEFSRELRAALRATLESAVMPADLSPDHSA
jgi:uncharacterized membrane protein